MRYFFTKCLLAVFFFTFCCLEISAQSDVNDQTPRSFNTKKNYVFFSGSIGGGDYPFAGLGINLSHQLSNGKTWIGAGAHYIGNTGDGSGIGGFDPIQVFPLMADLRHTFMQSPDGRFSTLLIVDGGYVVSITENGDDADGEYEYLNGWAINPGIGFRFNIFENMGLMIDITWLHHSSPRVWLAPVEKKDHKHWDLGLVRGSIFF